MGGGGGGGGGEKGQGISFFFKALIFFLLKTNPIMVSASTDFLETHGPSILAVKAKIYGVLYKQSSSIAFDETSSYWSALKKLLISRLFIGHLKVVWFPLVSIS